MYGKAIELFLVNGTADSLTTAELSNWNGKAIKIKCEKTSRSSQTVYKDLEGNVIRNPFLIGFKIYAPIGFCMYPLKNSFEIFGEFGIGMGFSGLWSGNFGNNLLLTKLYPSFFVNFRTGVTWDFINLTFNFSYDAIIGMSYGIELGAIINIGGSRTIGSTIIREEK